MNNTLKDHKDTLRRNLSGLYIFDILPQDNGKRKPTCVEDCTEDKRIEWMRTKDPEYLVDVARHLNEVFGRIWDMLTPEERDTIGSKSYCEVTRDKTRQIGYINAFCKLMRYVADCTGICAPDSEADQLSKDNDNEES